MPVFGNRAEPAGCASTMSGFRFGAYLERINMSNTTKFLLLGIVAGYILSPMLDRVPVINKLPKLG